MDVDRAVMEAVAAHRTGWATALAQAVMAVGQPLATYFAAAAVAIVLAWVYRAWRPVVATLVATMVAIAVADVAKDLIGRPRPPADLAIVDAGGLAMPSSIAALTAAAATPLVLAGLRNATPAGRTMAALLLTGTVAVGVCMVYLGAHWPSDVLVGWALGAAIGAVLFHLLQRWGRRRPAEDAGYPVEARATCDREVG
jgi:membrane-associated phospholipid phosphatase